ncbi:hypothetical protein D1Z90_15310 [Motilimonas pumila]|uniref:Uncharacterized protein n=1 Tax=Motilimonas pumila TaxID=2303987 RepID=A0A418YBZ6_9GAMM|nr:hypothetical protein D1Z90_15310 [Motilimonas pumila]
MKVLGYLSAMLKAKEGGGVCILACKLRVRDGASAAIPCASTWFKSRLAEASLMEKVIYCITIIRYKKTAASCGFYHYKFK